MATTAAARDVRAWAKSQGYDIGDRGRLPVEVWDAWAIAQQKASRRGARPSSTSAETPVAAVDPAQLLKAQQRIDQLEARLEQLITRLEKMEATAATQPAPKRRFSRSR